MSERKLSITTEKGSTVIDMTVEFDKWKTIHNYPDVMEKWVAISLTLAPIRNLVPARHKIVIKDNKIQYVIINEEVTPKIAYVVVSSFLNNWFLNMDRFIHNMTIGFIIAKDLKKI